MCVARTTLQPLLGRTVQFDSETSVGPRICSPMAATTSSARRRPESARLQSSAELLLHFLLKLLVKRLILLLLAQLLRKLLIKLLL